MLQLFRIYWLSLVPILLAFEYWYQLHTFVIFFFLKEKIIKKPYLSSI
jgi:hypothetical protein